MNQEILEQPLIGSGLKPQGGNLAERVSLYVPAALAILGSFAMVMLRINVGGERFISDGALMMLALASYLIAAGFHLTNLYAPFRLAEKLGMWAATLGVFFNLSSWLVRWVAAYDRELAIFKSGVTL